MNTIKLTHWCPRCRISQENWRVPNTTTKTVFRRGDVWESDLVDVYDKCEGCGTDIHGRIHVAVDDDGKRTIRAVEELGFRR